jgi:hypothetical protein
MTAIDTLRETLEQTYHGAELSDDHHRHSAAALAALEQLSVEAQGISFAIWNNSQEEKDAADRFTAALRAVEET